MKEFFALLLTVALSLAFCACGSTSDAVPTAAPTETPEVTAAPMPSPTPAPTPTPTPVPTAAPTPLPTSAPASEIKITKHPTGEAVLAGGKAMFIARADNADNLTWQLRDPNGTAYSTADAMNANPGLWLDVSAKDTITVNNAPASLNGWSMEAVFSNAGGSVVSNPAMIYVEQLDPAYAPVIEKYRNAYASGITQEAAYVSGYSEMAAYSEHVGYALIDFDGNGVKELVIAGTGTGNSSDGVLYEMCTVSGDQAVTLCMSRERSLYYLSNTGSVLNRGASGASYVTYNVMTVNGTNLLIAITLRSDVDENNQSVWYYYEAGSMSEEAQVSADQATVIINTLEGQKYLPQLTRIA